jgi:hypothetical protein
MIYPYWDGEQIRRGDPFRIFREIQHNGVIDMDAAMPLLDAGVEPETTKVVEVIAKAFGVSRWNEKNGLTDWEVLELLWELKAFLGELKKNISLGQTSLPITDLPSSTSPEVPSEVTKCSLGSGAIKTESKPGEHI